MGEKLLAGFEAQMQSSLSSGIHEEGGGEVGGVF